MTLYRVGDWVRWPITKVSMPKDYRDESQPVKVEESIGIGRVVGVFRDPDVPWYYVDSMTHSNAIALRHHQDQVSLLFPEEPRGH